MSVVAVVPVVWVASVVSAWPALLAALALTGPAVPAAASGRYVAPVPSAASAGHAALGQPAAHAGHAAPDQPAARAEHTALDQAARPARRVATTPVAPTASPVSAVTSAPAGPAATAEPPSARPPERRAAASRRGTRTGPVWRAPLRPLVVRRFFEPPPEPWLPGHRGVDLRGEPGQVVHAAGAGEVSFAGSLAGRGVVTVVHGELRTTYEPVEPLVAVGQGVVAGEPIGLLSRGHQPAAGSEARLHWGLLRGRAYLDPLLLLGRRRSRLLPVWTSGRGDSRPGGEGLSGPGWHSSGGGAAAPAAPGPGRPSASPADPATRPVSARGRIALAAVALAAIAIAPAVRRLPGRGRGPAENPRPPPDGSSRQ